LPEAAHGGDLPATVEHFQRGGFYSWTSWLRMIEFWERKEFRSWGGVCLWRHWRRCIDYQALHLRGNVGIVQVNLHFRYHSIFPLLDNSCIFSASEVSN
jgi:hypothetical protein